MLLTITTTHRPATDLGYLLHKNPARCQEFEVSFGKAHVFYPVARQDRCTAALLLDVDPVGIVRGAGGMRRTGLLGQYVNDRPFVASSFLSVAISQVFGTALSGRSKERPELVETPIPLEATLSVLPCRGGSDLLGRLFEPLGYDVHIAGLPLDEQFPDWGDSPYYTARLARTCKLSELLAHLYVLVPVLDNYKHYFVGDAEMDKLLARGAGWLAGHPEREAITKRYLKYKPSLARLALARLAEEDAPDPLADEPGPDEGEERLERPISLNDQRIGAVLAALRGCEARSVIDLGCGEGRLLRELMKDRRFERIVGMDVSIRSLEIAADKLRLQRLPDRQRQRVELIHGSLMYRDGRLSGFDAATVIEVIEHLDPPRLAAFERVLFDCAKPVTIVLTTPNREYNAMWENLTVTPADGDQAAVTKLRHRDHRFEWTRAEFAAWANAVADRFGYTVRFLPVGPEDPTLGPPTQMAVFAR
ncbi:MAG: 3' terminal RNA ribose 2'-O-methyltransferase Hen1 [Planctomycetota bacterium]|jgi:3' terminal RNA ribose 2'-O-methyltransferase Hen1